MKTRIPPPVYALLAAGLMWLLNQTLPIIDLSFVGGSTLGGFSWGFIIIGLALDLSSLALFLLAKTTPNPIRPEKANQLVIRGCYHFTRNPMYLGLVCLLIGWALRMGSLSPFFIIPLFMWVITEMQIKSEESWLRQLFGDDYTHYQQSVRRWL